MRSPVRVVATLVFTGLAVAYLVWKVDLDETIETLKDTDLRWFGLSIAIMTLTAMPMALRWKWLLAARGMLPQRRAIQRRRAAPLDALDALLGPRIGPLGVWRARRLAKAMSDE